MKRYTKNGETKFANRIVLKKDGMQILNPTHEMLIEDGWVEYVPPTPSQESIDKAEELHWQRRAEEDIVKMMVESYNKRTDISNNEALAYPMVVYPWKKYIGKALKTGQIVSYEERLYRVKQDITQVIDVYYPSIDTASLYEVIDREHEGTLEDPIPYSGNMVLEEGKYYIQDEVVYLCNRDSVNPVYHNLSDLVGIYVEKV